MSKQRGSLSGRSRNAGVIVAWWKGRLREGIKRFLRAAAAPSLSAKFRLLESREHALVRLFRSTVIDGCHGRGDGTTPVRVLYQELRQAHSAPLDDGREAAAHEAFQGSRL